MALPRSKKLPLLSKEIYKTQDEIVELEWNNNFKRADFLKLRLQHLMELRDAGNIYYPNF